MPLMLIFFSLWTFAVSAPCTHNGSKFADDLRTVLRQFSDLRQSYDLS